MVWCHVLVNSWVLLILLVCFSMLRLSALIHSILLSTYYVPNPILSTMEIKIRHDDQSKFNPSVAPVFCSKVLEFHTLLLQHR